MTKEQLAEKLDGIEYGAAINPDLLKGAKDNGLVIVYGVSDDLMELEGAIEDEGGCYDGEEFFIDKEGLLADRDQIEDDDELEEWLTRKKRAKKLHALWFGGDKKSDVAWTYKTTIPHATFKVYEGEDKQEVQCVGIVFSIDDL